MTKRKPPYAHGRSGRPSLYRDKIRDQPVTVTLNRTHHAKLRRNVQRLGISRSDFFALLIERYADVVQVPSSE